MKLAVVTGANTGIGLAIAARLLADGYALGYATADKSDDYREPYDDFVEQYGEARVTWIAGDLADANTGQTLLDPLERIDVLVNNAGLSTNKPFLETTLEDFDTTFAVDVRAAYFLSQQAARKMPDGGSIVNITSIHEHVPRVGFSVYAAAKAALGMFSHSLALELADRNIRVNSVAPGLTATPRNEKDAKELAKDVPLGRAAAPDEIAALVAWLCSDEATYITGQSYVIDGGITQNVIR